jgi:hypothetical protein
MKPRGSAYGLWALVLINSAVFILFAYSFAKPATRRDWRSFGAISAFIVALFAEMYGFPLTIYLPSGWLQSRYPGLDAFSHESGHLWHTLLGIKGNPHFDLLHILSNILILAGFLLLSSAWKVLYAAQSCRAANASGSRSPGRWFTILPSCSRMSRPGTWTRRWGSRSWVFSRGFTRRGRRYSWSPITGVISPGPRGRSVFVTA